MTDVYFVNDTTTAKNWGARGTTRALRGLVEETGANITHTLYLSEMSKRKPLLLHHIFPDRVRRYIVKNYGIQESYLWFQRNITGKSHLEAFKSYESLTSNWDTVPGSWNEFDNFASKVKKEELLEPVAEAIQATDIVVINGEGSIYDRQRKGRMMLFVAYLAKEYFDTDTILVNHTADLSDKEMRKMAANVYPILDDVVFREPASADHVSNVIQNVEYRTAADAAFVYDPIKDHNSWETVANRNGYYSVWPDSAAGFDLTEDYICVGGSSIYNRPDRPPYDPVPAFQNLCQRLKSEVGPVVLTACSGDIDIIRPIADELDLPVIGPRTPIQQLVDVFGNASLFISGRWHSSVYALTGGVPIITLTANTHKTKGILDLVGLDQPVFDALDLDSEVESIVSLAEELIQSPVKKDLQNRSVELSDSTRSNIRYIEKYPQ
ncbi:hypothetical protein AArcSl_2946 [Halalkaliarchaeum desulfuricum]|uniref:Polysaccharide pyruvyl transferase domain-containing protein n=1 Tax=Halalkaliarchaeum desulfuricum TaxID=2055893 RepID=A0A343TN85_9EURY|nr:polysaccharide pyruvyl transferase family protein [Halalkaliarchaeum desulfuricum]AUX10557.1 hypothetical protein AArcSl_2946 [Halalkaliarchaeum desulfuricum]